MMILKKKKKNLKGFLIVNESISSKDSDILID